MRTARLLLAISLSMGLGIAAAAAANPDLTTHRTSPNPVLWEIAEPAVSLPDFAQKLTADRRPADFEFRIDYTPDFVNINQLAHHSVDVESTGPYAIDGLTVVGPAPAATVIQALNLNSLRPVDIEYDWLNDPPVMTAVAVPNTGDNFAQWFIDTEATEASIQALPDGIPIPYRAVDIEFSGVNDNDERTYAIIAVINAGFAATGFSDWWARFDMTQSEILFFQQTLGRILDLEVRNGREADDPRWDAIFIPWDEDRPVYNHVASLASPTYSDPSKRGSIPRDFTDDFDPEVNDFEFDLPGLTAGFRLTDIEYYYTFDFSFGFDAFIKADGTFVDAATPLQFFARDAFGTAATEDALQSTEKSAFHMAEIGATPDADEIPGVHPQGRPWSVSSFDRLSVPAHMPFLTAYAVLNDDLDLTEQQLFTCDPSACPPPTNICDPRLFTIRDLLERMRDLQDYSSAQTLIEERYLPENINDFIRTTLNRDAPFGTQYLIDLGIPSGSGRYCDARVSLRELTELIAVMTDGTLGDAQSRADFLETMFAPAPPAVVSSIDAVIDDEASETDLTPVQIEAFKSDTERRWRTLGIDTFATVDGLAGTPVTRRASFAFVGVPVYDSSTDTTTLREFSINAYLESEADDATPLHEVTAEALRDAIADALAAWEERPAGCNDADFAEPLGTLDLADIVAFVTAFTANDPAADLDQSGLFDLADIVAFVTSFNAGCP
jgi:hypothetical protein